jgi:DNA-binding CsgD family transcriptional regulator
LDALFCTPALGVAIFDNRLRYRAVNSSLAAMNGVPAKAHLGKTLFQVLGDAAKMVEPAVQRVFVTGQAQLNSRLSAELRTRTEPGHWIVNYFPVKSQRGRISQVSVTVLEVTKRKKLEESLDRLSRNLIHVDLTLKASGAAPRQLSDPASGRAELLTQSIALLENCMIEARILSHLLRCRLPLSSAQPGGEPGPFERAREGNNRSTSESGVSRPGTLSSRERQIMKLLALGKSNKEMAQILGLSVRTVETHRAHVMNKLGVHSVGGLVLYAVRNHIIQL